MRKTRSKYQTVYSAKKRRTNKYDLVTLFGGACQRCGYSKSVAALHFHHEDPRTKKFAISGRGFVHCWEKLLLEAQKCELICANCHAEEHYS